MSVSIARKADWRAIQLPLDITQMVVGAFGATGVIGSTWFISYASIKNKKIEAIEAANARRDSEIAAANARRDTELGEVHRRANDMQTELDKSRSHAFEFEKKLNDLQIETDKKIAMLQRSEETQRDLYEKKIELLNEQIRLLTEENAMLKKQLADASAIGGTERRHGQEKARVQQVQVVNTAESPVPVLEKGSGE